MKKFYKYIDEHPLFAMILTFFAILAIASVVPLLLFGLFAIFYFAIGSFPLWIWLIPSIGSIIWYFYFFMGID